MESSSGGFPNLNNSKIPLGVPAAFWSWNAKLAAE